MVDRQERQLLLKGIAAAREGRKKEAIAFFKQVLKINTQNITAWLWLGALAHDDKVREYCAQKVLEIEPYNEHAIKMLAMSGTSSQNKANGEEITTRGSNTTFVKLERSRNPRPPLVMSKKRSRPKQDARRVVLGIVLLMIIGGCLFGITFQDSRLAEPVMWSTFGLWALSGYYGAFLLHKKGYGAEFLSCLLLAGGAPILVPPFFGPFMFAWGILAPDRTKRHDDS